MITTNADAVHCRGNSNTLMSHSACAGIQSCLSILPVWKCKRPPVARGPSCSYASTVCVVARLCNWGHNWEHVGDGDDAVSYTHLRAHETRHDIVCRLL